MNPIRIGTRGSMLAMAQARQVAEAITQATGILAYLTPFTTRGDRTAGALASVGGKGLFTAELETALRDGRIDLAVHSAKDMPARLAGDLCIAAVPPREDPRDVVVSSGGGGVRALPPGAVVGTSSPRRRAQLRMMRDDLTVAPLRGNIDTRIAKTLQTTDTPALHAVVLAMAGLRRSGLDQPHAGAICPLAVEEFIPAGGQGALVVQSRSGDERMLALTAALDHEPSRAALLAERYVLAGLDAGCQSCVAVHVRPVDGEGWQGLALVARPDGSDATRHRLTAPTAAEAGMLLLDHLLACDARNLLA